MFFLSLVVVLLAFIPSVIEFGSRVQYPTLRHGTVLVTGASKGIGRDAVDALVEDGYVVFAGVRKQSDVDALNALKNPMIKPVLLDVTDAGSISSAYDTVVKELKKLDKPLTALVNNAGLGPAVPLEFHELADAKRVFDTNLFGVLAVTQKFLPLLRQYQGRVINVSSLLGKFAISGFGVYCASKFALEGLSDSLRQELLPYKVSVSVVEPGVIKTPFHDTSLAEAEGMLSKEAKELYPAFYTEEAKQYRDQIMSRGASVKEVSAAIVHATSSTHPKTRYAIGNFNGIPAWVVQNVMWLAPDRIRDRLF